MPIHTFQENAFCGLNNLVNLLITYCQIPQMPPLNPVERALVSLALSHNKITSIPEGYFIGFPRLIYLDLAHNSLSSVWQLYPLYATLRTLYLDSNRLQTFPTCLYNATFTALNRLYLSFNKITECKKDMLNYIKSLFVVTLQANSISQIEDLRSLHRLRRLTVSDCSLSSYNEISNSNNHMMQFQTQS